MKLMFTAGIPVHLTGPLQQKDRLLAGPVGLVGLVDPVGPVGSVGPVRRPSWTLDCQTDELRVTE